MIKFRLYRAHKNRERGNALVEAVLVLPFLFMVMFFAMDICWYLYRSMVLDYATGHAVRSMSVELSRPYTEACQALKEAYQERASEKLNSFYFGLLGVKPTVTIDTDAGTVTLEVEMPNDENLTVFSSILSDFRSSATLEYEYLGDELCSW